MSIIIVFSEYWFLSCSHARIDLPDCSPMLCDSYTKLLSTNLAVKWCYMFASYMYSNISIIVSFSEYWFSSCSHAWIDLTAVLLCFVTTTLQKSLLSTNLAVKRCCLFASYMYSNISIIVPFSECWYFKLQPCTN